MIEYIILFASPSFVGMSPLVKPMEYDREYRSADEFSTNDGFEFEEEFEFEVYDDNGYSIYSDCYLMTIPGYGLFCADQKTTDRNELNILWKKLKEEKHDKYHEYVKKYKEENLEEFYRYRRKYSKGDECLYGL